jgi:hypothetical protein
MKLIDILARELKEWPEGVEQLTQSQVDNELYQSFPEDHPMGAHSLAPKVDLETHHSERDPYPVVTRAEWQVAVDAVNEPKVTEWNGEELPPVGTVCEFMKHSSPPSPEGQWAVGDIRYVSDCTVIIGGDKCEHVHHPRNCSFRPIRTPEQIAAEERLKAIDEMAAVYKSNYEGHVKDGCQALYDAGYRKTDVQ